MKFAAVVTILALASLATTGASVVPSKERVIDGNDLGDNRFSFVVSIQYLGHQCGGIALSSHWLLTSASCVAGLSSQATTVRWGSLFHNAQGTLTRVSRIVKHDEFNADTLFADIALVRTEDAMDLLPAVLGETSLYEHMALEVVGWGIKTADNGELSVALQRGTVPMVSLASCRPYYADLRVHLPADVFCAGNLGNGGVSICRGDIGGPVVYTDEYDGVTRVFGVSTFTMTCGGPRQPSVFTSVRPYLEWIRGTVAQG